MSATPSTMALHLRYRLWIAEMNLDINILRIFDDYLKEIVSKNSDGDIKTRINNFETQFTAIRKEIDDLKHEMHISKMNLAASSKTPNTGANVNLLQTGDHEDLEKRYAAFKDNFSALEKDFSLFEGEVR